MILYHRTDVDSALDILNNGFDAGRLRELQAVRPTQSGAGLYAASDPEIAWFFASMAPGNRGRGYTVIEVEVADRDFQQLERDGYIHREEIVNVPFRALQYRIQPEAFAILNQQAGLRPHRRPEGGG